ncbi:hypothetical protein ACIBH1_45645 [Nonomuraea sp. NPDC050663]|uniref:hypothetical protein n=1 Tax=Nonomuraea sp. NPDC050663 TaxID=3364370 RepID=UPI0037A41706
MKPSTLRLRAPACGWTVQDVSTWHSVHIARDDWTITVVFSRGGGEAPQEATIVKPGADGPAPLPLNQVTTYLHGNRADMALFRIGDGVIVDDERGHVTDITPEPFRDRHPLPVRLTVLLDNGKTITPYVTRATCEGATP